MDLLSVVIKPTWKEFLLDLVQSKQMDPWDIDLIAVSEAYLERVRALQAMDLRVPANVILACALLLRMKAETITFETEEPEEYYEAPPLIQEDLPPLVYRANRPRQRRVTLHELIKAVEQVMKNGERPIVKFAVPRELNIDLPKADMDELMVVVYEKAHALKDAEGVVLFSQLIQKIDATAPILASGAANVTEGAMIAGSSTNQTALHAAKESKRKDAAARFLNSYTTRAEGVVFHLLPVLHLAQDNKLLAWQNEIFGDIFIKVNGMHTPAPAAQVDGQPTNA